MNALTDTQICNTVLIVDDEPGQLDSLKELMALSGYEVSIANCGNEAIKLLNKNPYDTILLDLNMPNGSGYDVIDHVVDSEIHVKVIVVSGNTDFESTRDALKKGAYDFLKKPYVPDELLATVKNATTKKQLEVTNQTIHQKLEESEHLHRFIVDHSPDIVFMLDKEGHFTFLNDTVYQTLGFDKNELLGEHYSKLVFESQYGSGQVCLYRTSLWQPKIKKRRTEIEVQGRLRVSLLRYHLHVYRPG